MTDAYEVIGEYLDFDEAVPLEEIVDETELTTNEVKEGLRELMDMHVITSTPGFKYRFARNENARALFGDNE